MILLIDNYDSFSYNLYQLIGGIERDVVVVRNDAMTARAMVGMEPEACVISQGPGRPENAGQVVPVLSCLAGAGVNALAGAGVHCLAGADVQRRTVPICGVCLGHQAICQAFGAEITYAKELMHGKQSVVSIDTKCPIFDGCAPLIKVARYHSLAADVKTIPERLQVTAVCRDGEVMGVWEKDLDIFGVQFHPESILTPDGERSMRNFLKFAKSRNNF